MTPLFEIALGQADDTLLPLVRATLLRLPAGFALVAAGASAERPVAAAERELVRAAVPKRRADFITGRWCAHRALEALGRPCETLAVGPLGAPAWPAGMIGSITHDRGWCIAVAGPQQAVRGIGIDLYAHADLTLLTGLSPLIHSPRELTRYAGELSSVRHLRTLFCIKEAVVKAVSHEAGRFLDLRDIDIAMEDSRFEAVVLGLPHSVHGWHGVFEAGAVALATFATLALSRCDAQAALSSPS